MDDFTQSTDAKLWADEFCRRVREKGVEFASDEGNMISWFVSAIMRGYDTGMERGREAGMREAAGILGRRIGECNNMVASAPLTQRGINLYEDAARELIAMEAVILAAIGEGK